MLNLKSQMLVRKPLPELGFQCQVEPRNLTYKDSKIE